MLKQAKKKKSKLGVSSENEVSLNSGSKTEERDNGNVGLKNQKKKEKDGKKLKRKIDSVSQDEEPTRYDKEPDDSSVQPDATNSENEIQQKNKKNKKKKVAEKEENAQESGMENSDGTGSSPVATNDLKQTPDTTNEKKKKNKQNKQQEDAATPNTEEKLADKNKSVVEKKEKADAKPLQKIRKFSNGLVIEKLVIGKPDAKRASKGRKVGVRYVGKLKQNGKIFDSNIGKAMPFKFRLGIGKVIKGWDVGVYGMRVGDKRRLTIPPALGYGAKGCDRPAIPRNSWLVYDVELVHVH